MPLMIYKHAKFEVSSFNRSGDMERVAKFPKVGHVTPSWPPLTQFCILFVSAPRDLSACQIWSF